MPFLLYITIANLVYLLAFLLEGGLRVEGWVKASYLLSYSHGFVKRGLVGTLFHILHIPVGDTSIFVAYTVAFELLIALLYIFVRREGRNNPLVPYALVLFLLSPAGVLHMGDDVGRPDIYTYVLLLLSLLNLSLSPLLTLLAILIHEGYIFMGLPVLVAFAALKGRRGLAAINVLLAVMGVLLVSLLGRLTPEGLRYYAGILEAHGIGGEPLLPLSYSPLRNTLYFYTTFLSSPHIAKVLVVGFLSSLLLVLLYSTLYFRTTSAPILHRIVPFFPLLMFLFGVDYFRWTHSFLLSMLLWWVVLTGRYGVREAGRLEAVVFFFLILSFPAEILKEVGFIGFRSVLR